MNRAQALSIAALLATGCIPDTKKLDPLSSAAAVCPVLFDLLTIKLAECDGVAPYLADAYYTGATASCATIAAVEKAGRIGLDRPVAQACLDALAAPGCAGYQNACQDSPFVPRASPGSACVTDLECTAASAGCYNPDLVCPGTCMVPGLAGASCSGVDPPCGSSTFCDTSTATPICVSRATLGTSCSGKACLAGLYCDSMSLVCVKQLAQGVTCSGYAQCDDTLKLWCDFGGSSTCVPLPATGSPAGGRCDYPYQCATGLWCDYSASPNTCKNRVPVPQACTSDNGCSTPGSSCILDSAGSTTSHCRLLLTEGTACTPGLSQCQRGLWCDQPVVGPATCARLPTVGAPCGNILGEFVDCRFGWCDRPGTPTPSQGTCRAPVAAGQPCPTYNECANDGFGFTRTQCENLPGQGLTCVAPCPAP
jgi:hypothetical protein